MVLGCGALGSVAVDMLARAGVGHLVIVDRDFIELTNLQRQVLFDERDVAEAIPKAEAAKRKIGRINSQVKVTAVVDDINHTNIERYADGADVIVDGLDNAAWQAFGAASAPAFVLDSEGRIVLVQVWVDPEPIAEILEEMLVGSRAESFGVRRGLMPEARSP